jgi:nucleoside 2-deoxyribosyltransferase
MLYVKNWDFLRILPHRNAGLAKPYTIKEIFQKDLESLKFAELVVAVLNGASVDDGTAWEMGYAYALNTPIIGIIEDVRIRDPQLDVNLMISLTCEIVSSLQDLERKLKNLMKNKEAD